MTEQQGAHVAIVGGGVIGMSIAWYLAADGHRVRVIDPAPASGASWVAGGMLAPVAEAWPGEEALLELGSASLRRWPEFAARLSEAADAPSGLHDGGTLVVGVDSADRDELGALAEYLSSLGREVTRHSSRALRKLEPSLGPSIRGGLEVPGDLAVDNRAALAALRAAIERAGVEMLTATAREVRPGAVDVESGDGARSTVGCDVAVIAAGAHSGALHPLLRDVLRPVKGEVLRLRARSTALPPPTRTVRGPVHGRQIYLVPRDDGVVVGATQYEVGFDDDVTVGGVRDLIAGAERFVPGLAEYALAEAAAGFRPGTSDNVPALGWLQDGVLAAAGHHRNGYLLAPITAEAVTAMVRGRDVPVEVKAADPGRWGGKT